MKSVIVDNRISQTEKNNLKKLGLNIILVPPCNDIGKAISSHPDEVLCKIDRKNLVVYKNIPETFISDLKKSNIKITMSENTLSQKYPYDILLNGVTLKNFFIHNIKFTDPILYKNISNKIILNVKQGYSKCSTAVVNDSAIITNDIGISKSAKKHSIDALLLPPGDILLPGFDYGFIGGTCGLIDPNTLAFYGNLKKYKYGNEVLKFLHKYNITPLYLSNDKLIDRGSIICIDS
ncbi:MULTISPECIES: DUF6873 family GME fold protein [Clostridium]|uniref:DUF6873 family GME fold protein n=1 Tax=Clostridium TaxID=1485 RepID=UPI000825E47C|nr:MULTISPECIES: hypothetical protein [Clostridium]PJI09682.1 hypothetical protein CUB90_18230 [Clostridium sp. CT7]